MFLLSLYFALLNLKIWRTTRETYSPQTFSVTAAVVAPAVVICLNSLIPFLSSFVGTLIRAGMFCRLQVAEKSTLSQNESTKHFG